MEIRNQLAVCPYDHNHLVKRGRMQQHLVKCRQNHLHEEFKVCPFNACHRLHPAEFQFHINSCPDKECLEKEIYNRAKEQSGKLKTGNLSVPFFNNKPPPCNEDWDQDDDLQEDNYGETNGNLYDPDDPPQEPDEPEEMPPLQPRVLHTAVVSAMKKQNHDGKGLRQPKHLPKALGQHWPKYENHSPAKCENPAQELSHDPSTEALYSRELENNISNVTNGINNCIDPSSQVTHRTLPSESTCDMHSSKMAECTLSPMADESTLSSMKSDCRLSPKTSDPPLSSKISNHMSTSPTENSSSQETKPKNSLTLQCTTADKLKPGQVPTGDVSLIPISPLTEKMRSLGRGMLFKFQVKNSHPPGSVGSVAKSDVQTEDTDPPGCEKQESCQKQLAENCTAIRTSSDNKKEFKDDTETTHLQPGPRQNSLCDDKAETPSLGRGRGILALKFFRQLDKNQEPSVGNRTKGSAIAS